MISNQHNTKLAQAYEDVPYTSNTFAKSQPTRLHALATIKGLNPAPLETAKVLEIGCSYGGNLLPFAIRYPNSVCVGIDLSETHIQTGRQLMEQIGVNNIELVAADISTVSFNTQFDYIICHGVFSWIPESVQNAILRVTRDYLAPNGIAYISYNTYPGWKINDIAKELMLFGSNTGLPMLDRVEQSFEMLDFVRNILSGKNTLHAQVLSNLFAEIKDYPKYYIGHEYFENFNTPLYFREFVAKIREYGLAYVTDSSLPIMLKGFWMPAAEFEKAAHFFNQSVESLEQFHDFLSNRTFRCSVITRQSNLDAHNIDNRMESYCLCHRFYDIYLRLSFQFIEASEKKKAFWRISSGLTITSTPLHDALFEYLQAQNEPCKVETIFNHLKKRPDYNEDTLIDIVFLLIHDSHTYLCFAPEKHQNYGSKPNMPEIYRKYVNILFHNQKITSFSNQYNQTCAPVDALGNLLVSYLDGKHTMKKLLDITRQAIEADQLTISKDGEPQTSEQISDDLLRQCIKNALDQMQEYGYFKQHG